MFAYDRQRTKYIAEIGKFVGIEWQLEEMSGEGWGVSCPTVDSKKPMMITCKSSLAATN